MERILIVLWRTLGDVILGSTIVAEVIKKYPDAEITFAVWPEYAELVDTNPQVKGLILTKDWDVVLQEACSDRYVHIMILSQVEHTSTCWHQREKYKHGHLIDFYARRAGIEITERRTYMFPSEKDMEKVKEIAEPEAPKTIIIHTTSLVPEKNWPHFQEFIDEFNLIHAGRRIVQVGGPDDPLLNGVQDQRGKLTYNEIAALCSMADLFIGVDSGLTYIADSVECPIVCIMGMSNPVTSGPISGRACFIEPERPAECEWPCHTNCKLGKPCINTVTVEEVMKHVEEEISRRYGADNDESGR